jgi:hypothetical protein
VQLGTVTPLRSQQVWAVHGHYQVSTAALNCCAAWHMSQFTHSWSWALLEELSIVQLLKNFPAFYGNRSFITVVSILSQINSIHTIASYLSKIHFNNVHSHTSWSFQWSLSFWVYRQYPLCIPFIPIRATCPVHLILLDLIILIRLGEKFKLWRAALCSWYSTISYQN